MLYAVCGDQVCSSASRLLWPPGNRVATARRKALSAQERRRWERLPIALPVFVLGTDEVGERFLEFATVLNIGGGGALIALRRHVRIGTRLTLESPEVPAPLEIISTPWSEPAVLASCWRSYNGSVIRIRNVSPYHLLAIKFTRRLIPPSARTEAPPTG